MSNPKTFRDFLNEDNNDLLKKCKPFLEQSKGLPLYRGYGGAISSIVGGVREVPIRKDRRPRDTSAYVHTLLDAYFQRKFGAKVRSEGLFATGDRTIVARYGHPHWVFPVGNFKFVWGTYNGDPVADTLWWTRKIKDRMISISAVHGDLVTDEIMNEIDWYSDDLPKAISSGAEIAILADSAILIPYSDNTPYKKIIGG